MKVPNLYKALAKALDGLALAGLIQVTLAVVLWKQNVPACITMTLHNNWKYEKEEIFSLMILQRA